MPTPRAATTRLGAEVRARRAELGQVEAAAQIGIPQATLSRVERGTHPPSRKTALRLAAWLGWSVGEVVDAAEEPAEPAKARTAPEEKAPNSPSLMQQVLSGAHAKHQAAAAAEQRLRDRRDFEEKARKNSAYVHMIPVFMELTTGKRPGSEDAAEEAAEPAPVELVDLAELAEE